MPKTKPFEKYHYRYDDWFVRHATREQRSGNQFSLLLLVRQKYELTLPEKFHLVDRRYGN